MKLKTNKNSTISQRKNRNKKNKDRIWKKIYILNWNLIVKLKTNKIFIKWSRTKFENQMNKDQIEKIYI
jgi:hypothetical protein